LIAPVVVVVVEPADRRARAAARRRRRGFLRTVARRTWRFFEVHGAVEDNFLPPDKP